MAAFREALDRDPTNTEARLLSARALEEKSPVEALRLRAVFLLVDDPSLAADGLAAVAEAILVCRNTHELRDLESGFQALRVIRRQRPAIEAAYRMIRLALIAHHNDPDARAELDLWAGAFRPITGPVWALTGTFGLESAKGKVACRPLVVGALKGLQGTVIPGANRDEVSGLLKESNREQVRRSKEVLSAAGFEMRLMTSGGRIREFSTEEVDTLAEAEHARWVLERLEAGWHPGPEKDVERKLSPHLIPWDRLSTEIQNQDRSTVRKLPQLLAQVGLEVVRIASPGGKGAGVESLPGSPRG